MVDYASQSYNFFINGTQANPSPIGFYTSNNVNTLGLLRIFRGTTQAGMIVDDLSISSTTPTNPIARITTSSPFGFRYRILDVGSATPDTNSIAVTLDGVSITPTAIVQSGNIGGGDGTGATAVYYESNSRMFITGTSHAATIHYTGTGFDPVNQTNTFTVTPLVGSLDRVHHFPGRFQGTPAPGSSGFTGGRTGAAADFALDMQNPPGAATKFFADDPDLLAGLNKAMANDVISCSVWTKRRTLASSSVFWLNSPNAPVSGRAFQLHGPYSDNTFYFDTGGGTVPTSRLSTNVTYLGGLTFWTNWHHIVAIKNGGAKQIWIDGQLLIEQTSGAASISGYNDLNRCIVGAASPDNLAANSILDDFAAFNTALTPVDVAALFSGTAPNAIPSASSLIAWWDFNDAPGLAISSAGSQPVIQFSQMLQSSTNANGPYLDLPSATSPYTNTSGTQMFFRTRK